MIVSKQSVQTEITDKSIVLNVQNEQNVPKLPCNKNDYIDKINIDLKLNSAILGNAHEMILEKSNILSYVLL